MRFVRGCHKFDVITWDRATLSHRWRSTVAKKMLHRVCSVLKNIAMGYVKNGHHKKGTELAVEVRNKIRKAIVTPMPFVPSKFYRGPEKS